MKSPSRFFTLLAVSSLTLLTSGAHAGSVDPKALALLKSMSDTLASAKAFTYRTKSVVEVPGRTGQYITLFSTADIALKRPNKLSAVLTGEAPNFRFYYDGETVAAYAPQTHTYSLDRAPGTIDAMIPALEDETGIRFVTAPLLLSNPYASLTRSLQSGIVVGSTTVDGAPCSHLAFKSPGVNWEIWIQSGSPAVPRRLAVTFTDKPGFPRTLIKFTNWNLNPWLRPREFTFHLPAGAQEIPFRSVMKPAGR